MARSHGTSRLRTAIDDAYPRRSGSAHHSTAWAFLARIKLRHLWLCRRGPTIGRGYIGPKTGHASTGRGRTRYCAPHNTVKFVEQGLVEALAGRKGDTLRHGHVASNLPPSWYTLYELTRLPEH